MTAGVNLSARMKLNTGHKVASHNRAAAGERAEVLTRHVSADTECAAVRNLRADYFYNVKVSEGSGQ